MRIFAWILLFVTAVSTDELCTDSANVEMRRLLAHVPTGGPRKLDFPFRVAACYDKIIFLTYVGARFTHMDFYVILHQRESLRHST